MDQKQAAYYTLYQPSYNNCAAVVSYMAQYFMQYGKYFKSVKELCKGDIVFFQNSSGLSHVGLCIDWGGGQFITVEGNKDNQVKKCYYPYSSVGGYVAGFAHPRYTDEITRDDAIAYAISQIGYKEGSNNWNKYAQELDAVNYFAGCGKKQYLPWCAVFICAVMYDSYKATPAPTPPSPTPTPTDKEYKVVTKSGDCLRIREKPTTESEQVGYIGNGEIIKPESIVNGQDVNGCDIWAKYLKGYCSCAYLVEVTTTKTYKVKTNTGSALRIREKPTTNSKQVGYIDNGNTCQVDDITNGWAHVVDYNGITGYAYAQYLKEV